MEMKTVEEELAFQAQLLSCIHEAIIVVDENKTLIYWNKIAERILGWKSSEAIGQQWSEVFGQLQIDHLWSEITETLKSLSSYESEICGHRKDGTVLYAEVHSKQIHDQWGNIKGTVITLKDITNRNEYEQTILKKEQEYHQIIDSSSDGSYIYDLESGEMFYSKEWQKRLGIEHLTPSEAAFVSVTHVHPDDRERIQGIYRKAVQDKAPKVQMEFRAKEKDDNYIWILGQANIIYNEDGKPIKYLGTHKDITEQKKMEESMTIQAHTLASLQEAICAVDENFNITFWNPKAEEIFGWTAREAIGSPSKEIFKMISPSNREESIENILNNNGYTGEAIYRNKNGKEVHTSVICSIMRDAQQNYMGNVSSFRDITEHKIMEAALRESEKLVVERSLELEAAYQYNKNIVEGIADCFYTLDKDLRFCYVNKAAEEIWGLSSMELIGRRIEEVFPGLIDISLSYFRKALEEQSPQQYEVYSRVIQRWGDMNVYPTQDGVSVYFRDTTERKRAQEALRESEEKYHNLFNSMDEGYCIIEVLFNDDEHPIDYRFLEVNQAFERQTGLVDAIGRCMRDMAPAHEQHWFDIYGRIALTGEPERFQNPAEALGRFYDVYAFRVGKPEQRRVAILFNDITERRFTEEALRESEEKYRLLFENMTEMFQILEPILDNTGKVVDFRYIEINKASESLTGKKREEIEGKTAKELWGVVEDYWLKMLGTVLRTGEPAHMENYSQELDAYYDLSAWKAGERRVAIVFTNITDRRRAEELLKKSKEALEKSIIMKDEFLSLISHEFRTPLTVIISAIQMLKAFSWDELSGKAKGYFNTIRQNSNRQLKLVNNILDITKVNAGSFEVHKTNSDIVQLTKLIIESIGPYADRKKIKVSFLFDPAKIIIGIDVEKYERILLNLLSNAIKYTPKGESVTVKLSKRTVKNKTMARVQVCDNGIGIPADKQEHIFERFGQVDSILSRQAEGTGIGLHLTRMFVEMLGGEIRLDSKLGKGSTFTVLIPAIKVQETYSETTVHEIADNRTIQLTEIEFSDIYLDK